MRFAVLGGDRRQEYLRDYLLDAGWTLSPADKAEVVIFPMPALDKEGNIRGTELRPEDIAEELAPDALVLGGRMASCAHLFSRCEDYALWETLARGNAALTAEGAIQLAMEQMPAAMAHSRFLVVGAGRIGTVLAQKLQALGADVTLTARRQEDFVRLETLGIVWDVTREYQKGLDYDCVINTVPSPVFTEKQIADTPKHCLFLELASAPYGICQENCEDTGRQFLLGQGLPGRCCPKTAGELIAQGILTFLHG